jgi:hypothetical protein
MNDINLGAVSFEELGKWSAEETILALQWLNANVGSLTSRNMEFKLINIALLATCHRLNKRYERL